MDITIIVSTLAMLILAEIGDKTQLAAVAISLCNTEVKTRIFVGCILGFTIVNIVAISLGGLLSLMLPYNLIKIFSATAFLIFGILLLTRGGEIFSSISGRHGLITSMILIGSLELGDKTNLATLGLAVYFGLKHIYELIIGLTFASIILMGVAFVSASIISKLVSKSRLRYISASVFILIAVYLLVEAVVGILSQEASFLKLIGYIVQSKLS